jgi:hypothetical protein
MTVKAIIFQAGDGTAIPAGMVGEQISGGGTGALTNQTWYSLATIALTAGVWRIDAAVDLANNAVGTTWRSGYNQVATISNVNNGEGTGTNVMSSAPIGADTLSATAYIKAARFTLTRFVTVAASTNYFLNAYGDFTGSAPTANGAYVATRIG